MKKLFTVLACALLLGAFTGCSKDDDHDVDAALLVGSWQQTAVYDGEYDEWVAESDVLVLNADGTGYQARSFSVTPSSYDRFTWRCEGDTFVQDYGGGEVYYSTVETLNQTELVLAGEYEGEDGGRYTDRAFYERVK